MRFIKKIAECLSVIRNRRYKVGKIVLITAAITAIALAFIPTVFVKNDNGFDVYSLFSKVSYKNRIGENGKKEGWDFNYNLFDLERYGIKKKKS